MAGRRFHRIPPAASQPVPPGPPAQQAAIKIEEGRSHGRRLGVRGGRGGAARSRSARIARRMSSAVERPVCSAAVPKAVQRPTGKRKRIDLRGEGIPRMDNNR